MPTSEIWQRTRFLLFCTQHGKMWAAKLRKAEKVPTDCCDTFGTTSSFGCRQVTTQDERQISQLLWPVRNSATRMERNVNLGFMGGMFSEAYDGHCNAYPQTLQKICDSRLLNTKVVPLQTLGLCQSAHVSGRKGHQPKRPWSKGVTGYRNETSRAQA